MRAARGGSPTGLRMFQAGPYPKAQTPVPPPPARNQVRKARGETDSKSVYRETRNLRPGRGPAHPLESRLGPGRASKTSSPEARIGGARTAQVQLNQSPD